jgi:anti-sigma factor RsiW
MTPAVDKNPCEQAEMVAAYAVQALSPGALPAVEAHIASCPHCQRELEALRPVMDAFVCWPTDVLRPAASLQERLAQRIAEETDGKPVLAQHTDWREPAWEEVAPGISCKLLATDEETHRVSMLVRLAPGVDYPPHMPVSRSCISSTASCGSTTASSTPGTTTAQSPAPATSACGAKPAARAFSLPVRETFCADRRSVVFVRVSQTRR